MKLQFVLRLSSLAAFLILGGGVLPSIDARWAGAAYADEGVRAVKSVCDWEDLGWADLNAAEKKAWSTLGWSQGIWDREEDSALADKGWKDLTDMQRSAAKSVGYDQQSWENDPCD